MSFKDKSPRTSTSENLQQLNIKDHYQVIKELGRGTYGKVLLARCRETNAEVALKVLLKQGTKLRDFRREFKISYFLSPHFNIMDTYNVAFETPTSFVFAQEYAPLGDLFDVIEPQVGMTEDETKLIVKQIGSALDFMHSKQLVHRDIKPENVLVFAPDYSKVKLMDFGMTRQQGSVIRKTNGSIPYTPPEICEAVRNETIIVQTTSDVWAFGVLIFCILTGNFPWESADIGDVYFKEFVLWQRRKTVKIPSQWRKFTPRFMRLFRKMLEIKPDKRCNINEVYKYMSNMWLTTAKHGSDDDDCISSDDSG
ncbi:hypothetical protein LOTGIDRAFT_195744, partial [Lottia gigantea]